MWVFIVAVIIWALFGTDEDNTAYDVWSSK